MVGWEEKKITTKTRELSVPIFRIQKLSKTHLESL